jgi:hypothetical protein
MTSVTDAGGPDSRRLGLALAAVLFAMLLVPNLAVAQAHCEATVDTSDAALAARYASVLRFAPNEPYFPTIPFFSAFDTQHVVRRGSHTSEPPQRHGPTRGPGAGRVLSSEEPQ